MNIKPLADRVLILPAPAEEKTIGLLNMELSQIASFASCTSLHYTAFLEQV